MKSVFKNLVLCILIMVAYVNQGIAQSNFILTGAVSCEGRFECPVNIEVFLENNLVEKVLTNPKGEYSIELEINTIYTLKYTEPSMITKLIQVNTYTPKNKHHTTVTFHVSLMKGNASEALIETNELDFPFAIVKYDAKSDSFQYSIEYTEHMKEMEYQVLDSIHHVKTLPID